MLDIARSHLAPAAPALLVAAAKCCSLWTPARTHSRLSALSIVFQTFWTVASHLGCSKPPASQTVNDCTWQSAVPPTTHSTLTSPLQRRHAQRSVVATTCLTLPYCVHTPLPVARHVSPKQELPGSASDTASLSLGIVALSTARRRHSAGPASRGRHKQSEGVSRSNCAGGELTSPSASLAPSPSHCGSI